MAGAVCAKAGAAVNAADDLGDHPRSYREEAEIDLPDPRQAQRPGEILVAAEHRGVGSEAPLEREPPDHLDPTPVQTKSAQAPPCIDLIPQFTGPIHPIASRLAHTGPTESPGELKKPLAAFLLLTKP